MTSGGEFPRIPKPELFGRLAEGDAARVTVVTPNLRLATALARDFDARQLAQGLASWETADILPFSAFVERLYEDALYSEPAAKLPLLLGPAQEQALWENIVRASEAGGTLLSADAAAALAREVWQTAHAWRLAERLKGYPANDDARAFADWAWRYQGATARERHTDRARLPDVVIALLQGGRTPFSPLRRSATLVAYGFDILNPQQRDFFAGLAQAGVQVLACEPDTRDGRARRLAFASASDEIRAAACWARARLEANPSATIGIVVPDLAQSRRAVQRIFAQVLSPARALPGAQGTLPFNISLGEPLDSYPLVAAAMLVLEVARAEVEFSRASRLIRSPFIAGAQAEMGQRARLDAELRTACGAALGLERLRRRIARLASDRRAPVCPILAQRLAELSKAAKEQLHGAKHPSEWGRAFSALLAAAGFPGERSLDSAEYQTLKKLHEAIAGLTALDRVAAHISAGEALARLKRIAADTLFQPEAPEVPIQVLGVLESAGLEFDCLWVMGLSDESWPIAARPNPLLPVALQRAAGVPEASAASSFELDARITRGWLGAAREVILSHALAKEDRELVASPLIRAVALSSLEEIGLPEYGTLRNAIRGANREERIADARAPAIPEWATSAGGTRLFADQAACPFRAFALHRLRAEAPEAPSAGPDARERGTLVHAMLAHVWRELKTKARLDAASGAELDSLLAAGAAHAIRSVISRRPDALAGRFAELEKERLAKLGRVWLEVERARPPFEVAAIEHQRAVAIGGVTVNARLDRLDRVLGEGQSAGHAVIDYKTGAAKPGDWLGPRPDDPQLPLYAVSGAEDVCALAFARLKPGEFAFRGIARGEGLIPGVATLEKLRGAAARDYASWEDLLAGWRAELEALGSEFAAGEARVDPKRGEQTCRRCELQPLCRISERAGERAGDGSGAADA